MNWGGADIAVVPPPPRATPSASGADTEGGLQPLPRGPVLYYAARTESGAQLLPLAEISGDSLLPIRPGGDPQEFATRFVGDFMRQGAEFTLFARGTRAGTFVVASADVPRTPTCPFLPRATGTLELSGGVMATEFLALARAEAPQVPRRADGLIEVDARMRFVAPILAERMLRARSAGLPGNWQAAMAQVTAFPLDNLTTAAFAATFLVGDELHAGLDNNGYSLFFIAAPSAQQTGWDTAFVSFRNYPETGKAAPRVVDYLDWDRDEAPELLLQVYGIADTWFEAVGRDRNGTWQRIFRDRCEEGSRAVAVPAAPTDTTLPADSL